MNDELEDLGAALDEDGFERLAEQHPAIAKAVDAAIIAGHRPVHVKNYVLHRTGSPDMARWCMQAAVHLSRQRGP